MIHLLFLCSGDGARSRSARQLFSRYGGVSVRAAQLSATADGKVDRAALRWADVVVVMERQQRRILERRFRWNLCAKRIFCLDIPDHFTYLEPALMQRLQDRVPMMLPDILPQTGLLPDERRVSRAEPETATLRSPAPPDGWPTLAHPTGFGFE